MPHKDKGAIRLKDDDAKEFMDEEVGSKVSFSGSGILEMTSMEKEVDYDEGPPMPVGSGGKPPKERIIPRARIRIESITSINSKPVKRRDI